MEIVNFFETLAGKWFSQRTTHYLTSQTSRAGQSNLEIEFLAPEDAAIAQLCQQLSCDPAQATCGLRIHHDSRMDGDTQNTKTSALMVILQPENSGIQGKLLHGGTTNAIGDYSLENEILTIVTPTPNGQTEERLWFVNPNLRMRTSALKVGDSVEVASFCSEIRMGVTRPPQEG